MITSINDKIDSSTQQRKRNRKWNPNLLSHFYRDKLLYNTNILIVRKIQKVGHGRNKTDLFLLRLIFKRKPVLLCKLFEISGKFPLYPSGSSVKMSRLTENFFEEKNTRNLRVIFYARYTQLIK